MKKQTNTEQVDAVSSPPASTLEALGPWRDRQEALVESFGRYLALLLETNAKFNLTGDTDPMRLWQAHIEDALLAASIVEERFGRPEAKARILDVGSGAGIPGIVWAALWPEARMTLLEAKQKKCGFLNDVIETLDLGNAGVVTGRAEAAGHEPDHRETYDIVVARAVAPMATLAEWTLPFVRVGGRLIAIKGADIEEELDAAAEALATLGAARVPEIVPYVRADGKNCALVICTKSASTDAKYPRRAGMAKKRPIGAAARKGPTNS